MFAKKYRTLDLIVGRIVYVEEIEPEKLGTNIIHYRRVKKLVIVKKSSYDEYEIITLGGKLNEVRDFSLKTGDVALEIVAPLVAYGRFPNFLTKKEIVSLEERFNRQSNSKDAELTQ